MKVVKWVIGTAGIATLLYNGWVFSTWDDRALCSQMMAVATTFAWWVMFNGNWSEVGDR